MIRWIVVPVLGMVLLAGCGPTAEEQSAMDYQRCDGFGLPPGSPQLANCMMNVSQRREAQQAADRRAADFRAAADRPERERRDAADRDAWDRRTGQGIYTSAPCR